jgi:hypothetical protein
MTATSRTRPTARSACGRFGGPTGIRGPRRSGRDAGPPPVRRCPGRPLGRDGRERRAERRWNSSPRRPQQASLGAERTEELRCSRRCLAWIHESDSVR